MPGEEDKIKRYINKIKGYIIIGEGGFRFIGLNNNDMRPSSIEELLKIFESEKFRREKETEAIYPKAPQQPKKDK